jgi:hypothetical protein
MVTDEAFALIIGQWGVQCSACVMCQQHEVSANVGIASTTMTSTDATSLKRHFMFLKQTNGLDTHWL